jgi:hypothetical protein
MQSLHLQLLHHMRGQLYLGSTLCLGTNDRPQEGQAQRSASSLNLQKSVRSTRVPVLPAIVKARHVQEPQKRGTAAQTRTVLGDRKCIHDNPASHTAYHEGCQPPATTSWE